MKHRAYNFSAGPSMLPLKVIEEVAAQLENYQGTGESVMEMSHRSEAFKNILKEAEADLRKLMDVPENYKILFLQGGATLQFSMIPINLMNKNKKADYIVAGSWGKKAAKEGEKFGDVKVIDSSETGGFTYIPKVGKEDLRADSDYVHITFNNTIYGTHYNEMPDFGEKILVADMSSCILSEKVDVSKFGLIYAGAQKNVGPAGVTIVIVREDLIGKAPSGTPVYLDYNIHAENDFAYNTPPCFAIYVAGRVFKELIDKGGIENVNKINRQKAEKLYDFIDASKLFKSPIKKEDRSLMNVVFVTGDKDQEKRFISEAKAEGLHNLGGHRSIGGMRASIYNAMPMEGVEALIDFMKKFEEAES